MKANEIRVGNILSTSRGIVTVENIGEIGINVECGTYGTDTGSEFEELKGIPLTPEILKKCGFKLNEHGRWYIEFIRDGDVLERKIILFIAIEEGRFIWFGLQDSIDFDRMSVNTIHYLHQLQNLYFALTGEELNINL